MAEAGQCIVNTHLVALYANSVGAWNVIIARQYLPVNNVLSKSRSALQLSMLSQPTSIIFQDYACLECQDMILPPFTVHNTCLKSVKLLPVWDSAVHEMFIEPLKLCTHAYHKCQICLSFVSISLIDPGIQVVQILHSRSNSQCSVYHDVAVNQDQLSFKGITWHDGLNPVSSGVLIPEVFLLLPRISNSVLISIFVYICCNINRCCSCHKLSLLLKDNRWWNVQIPWSIVVCLISQNCMKQLELRFRCFDTRVVLTITSEFFDVWLHAHFKCPICFSLQSGWLRSINDTDVPQE